MKRILSFILALAILFAGSAVLNGCSNNPQTEDSNISQKPAPKRLISAVYPGEEEHINLVNEDIRDFLSNYTKGYSSKYYAFGEDHFTGNETVNLQWTYNGENEAPEYYIVTYGLDPELADSISVFAIDNSQNIVNLFVNSKYYWQVTAVFSDHSVKSAIFTFYTEDTPRIVIIDGVSNTRDLGGYETEDGRRVKQGIVYRSGYVTNVSAVGKSQATGDLGIKTELDLLENDLGSSKLGDSVQYINIYAYSYGDYTNSANRSTLVKELRVFADKDNYPIVFHCAAGRDRTGSLAATLLALCGVPEEQILKDYELSFFSAVGSTEANADGKFVENTLLPQLEGLISTIKSCGKNSGKANPTLADCTEQFLLEAGLTQEEIDAIRANLIG